MHDFELDMEVGGIGFYFFEDQYKILLGHACID